MLILAVAYSASIGGMITPIGTIPNAILVAFLNENYNYQIDFIDWLLFTLPLAFLNNFNSNFSLALFFHEHKR